MKKRIIAWLLIAVMVLGQGDLVYASEEVTELYSGTCGTDLTWMLTSDGVLTISGTGDMTDYNPEGNRYNPWHYYTDLISSIKLEEGITSIGNYSFYYLNNLTEITFPESLTDIGKGAFMRCSALESVTFQEGLKSIDEKGFWACTSLAEVTLPDSVAYVGKNAFAETSMDVITGVIYGVKWTYTISTKTMEFSLAGDTSVSIPGGNAEANIYPNWRSYTGQMEKLLINEGISGIEQEAFFSAVALKEVTIPEGVTSIGKSAFAYCSSLETVDLPESLTSMDDMAFSGCSSLVSVDLPDNTKKFGNYIFQNCTALENATLPDGIAQTPGCMFKGCTSLTSIEIPDTVTNITGQTFSGCTGLAKADIPETVTEIGDFAFYGCNSLTGIVIPENLTTIGEKAFYECSSIEGEITIPETITYLSEGAFYGCSGLKDIYIMHAACSIRADALPTEGVTIHGYDASTAADYAASNGLDFVSLGKTPITHFTANRISSECYTGSPIEPRVTIEGLVEGTDYEVSYENNLNCGVADVIVTGIGDYTGTDTYHFYIGNINIADYEDDVRVEYSSVVYNGKAYRPKITVGDFVEGQDFVLEYKDNVEAGKAQVVIWGINNCVGFIANSFIILPLDISGMEPELEYTSVVYDGMTHKPEVTLPDLQLNKHYVVSYTDNINAGQASVTITGRGSCVGTIERTFDIEKLNVEDIDVDLNSYYWVYDGNEKTPEISYAAAVNNSASLDENDGWDVTYEDNINAGTAYLVLTGKNSMEGTRKIPFYIKQTVQSVTVTDDTFVMTAGETREIEVTRDGEEGELVYTSADSSVATVSEDGVVTAVSFGETEIEISVPETDNIGTQSAKMKVIVGKRMLSDGAMKIDCNSYVYDGTEKKPAVTVYYGTSKLTEGLDYTVTYSDNVTNAGNCKVTATGLGIYYGTFTESYYISRAEQPATLATESFDLKVGETGQITYENLMGNPDITYYSNATDVADVDENGLISAYEEGSATVYLRIAQCDNYDISAEMSVDVTVTKDRPSMENCDITIDSYSYTYTGGDIWPEPTVKYNGTVLTQWTDYTLDYENTMDAGTATLTVTGKGDYTGSKVINYEILPVVMELTLRETDFYPVANREINLGATLQLYVDGIYEEPTITYSSSNTAVLTVTSDGVATAIGAGTVTVTATVSDTTNYTGGTCSMFITVVDPDAGFDEIDNPEYIEGGNSNNSSTDGTTSNSSQTTVKVKRVNQPKVTKAAKKKVKVTWKKITGVTGYQISCSTKKNKTKIVATVKGAKVQSKKLTVKRGTYLYYKVRAYKTVNGNRVTGNWSKVRKFKLK